MLDFYCKYSKIITKGSVRMKTFKKIISVVLALVMCLSFLAVGASAQEKSLNYLVIGDSIAKGFGLVNRDETAYGRIVADTNGYNYRNFGLTGCTSDDMLGYLTDDDAYSMSYQSWVRWADIISISVGGNDYLLDNAVGLIFSSLILNNYTRFDSIAEKYYNNFSACIERIHELNPDAVILIQTLFNTWTTFAGKVYKNASNRINDKIMLYLDEHPGSFYVVDTVEAFEGKSSLITSDTIHPNAQGNILLARLTLEKLNEIGLGAATEPVVLVEGEDRDYLIEYFPPVIGPIITLLANLATGNIIRR